MADRSDRLYELMPGIHRVRDAERGYPLRALLRVVAEQVNIVEDDITRLYENWFIETCDDWVVPYIGALLGFKPSFEQGESACECGSRTEERTRILIPRREVARTIHYRRRKGTVRLLEELAAAVAGWPARAVEFYRLLGVTQNINYLHLDRGRTVDVREGDVLCRLNGPFDRLGHTVDVRRINSAHGPGRFNIPEVGVFVWRLRPYRVTEAPAYCYEEESPQCFLFSAIGNNTPLFTRPVPATGQAPGELNVPAPITRRSFAAANGVASYYGPGRSFYIWTGTPRQAVPAERIMPADLSDWSYRPLPGQVAVDPELGRIAFAPGPARLQGVWVTYAYGFSADMGGGEYDRLLSQPTGATVYQVGAGETMHRIGDAITRWKADAPRDAVIEITDSGVYVEPILIELADKQTLQLRAARGRRPVIRLLNWQTSQSDHLTVTGEGESWFTLDGIVVTGRGMQISGGVSGVRIRHSTLVPGWGLDCDCEPLRPAEPSVQLIDAPKCLTIERSIVGSIQVDRDEVNLDPVQIRISDSIVDATSDERVAIGAPGNPCAHAVLTLVRSTVFGRVEANSIELAENSIMTGFVRVCRRQNGCIRFCYLPSGSFTPRRYECQPDLVVRAVIDRFNMGDISADERDELVERERLRVRPDFDATRYGLPTYGRLAADSAEEITHGAEDESEMGVFHDLYAPQRAENLRSSLDEYTPAGMDVGIIYAS